MDTITYISCAHLLLLPTNHVRRRKANSTTAKASPEKIEIRVCTNRTCRKQGSLDALQVLSGVAPPFLAVNSCGCLGRCGSGPNIVILPEAVFVGHCGTPSKAVNVMAIACGLQDNGECLEALALRKRAEDEMGRGDFAQACRLLSQVLSKLHPLLLSYLWFWCKCGNFDDLRWEKRG